MPGIITREKLPRLLWSTEIAGQITAKAAAETGLAIGTPVTTGTIDAAAEAVSVGVRDTGDMMNHLHHHPDRRAGVQPVPVVCAVVDARAMRQWPGWPPVAL